MRMAVRCAKIAIGYDDRLDDGRDEAEAPEMAVAAQWREAAAAGAAAMGNFVIKFGVGRRVARRPVEAATGRRGGVDARRAMFARWWVRCRERRGRSRGAGVGGGRGCVHGEHFEGGWQWSGRAEEEEARRDDGWRRFRA